jgi:SRSO17 transposase
MLARAHAAGVPFAWVTADSVYGADHALRRWLQDRLLGYVLTVTRAQRLGFARVEDLAEEVPADGWHRLSAGDGAKGPRLYDWAYAAYAGDAAPGWEKGLLIRRSLAEPDKTTFSFYLTLAPDGTALAELVRVAGTRWAIEACFEAAKGEVGLDQYEVRSWSGWHRHVTLAMLAHAYLDVVRQTATGGSATVDLAAELLPPTVPEVRRLLWSLVWARPPDPDWVIAWSHWRRRHQQRARRAHRRRRTGHETRL